MINQFKKGLLKLACIILPLLPLINSAAAYASCTLTNAPVCLDSTPCKEISNAMVCLYGTPASQVPPGGSVLTDPTATCWNYQSVYTCSNSSNTTDTCGSLVAQGCGQINSTCVDWTSAGQCDMNQLTYQCQTAPGTTTQVMNCSGQIYCMNGNCTNTGYQPDQAFGQVVATMEVGREAGTYLNTSSLTLFDGSAGNCTVTVGVFDCCKTSTKGSSMNNYAVAQQLATKGVVSTASYFGAEAIHSFGNSTMYDALFGSDMPSFLQDGMSSLMESANNTLQTGPTISYMGVTVGYGSPVSDGMIGANQGSYSLAYGNSTANAAVGAVNTANADLAVSQTATTQAIAAQNALSAAQATYNADMVAGNFSQLSADQLAINNAQTMATIDDAAAQSASNTALAATTDAQSAISTASADPSLYASFSAVAFYVAIAIMVYQYLSQCSQEQQVLAEKRGQNLCQQVGTYCSQKFLGVCMQNTQSFCCYNSVLSKTIEVGAHQQLNLSWGSAQTPSCTGLTIAQLGQIDFSKIDFSQFIATIMPNQNANASFANGRANTLINSYYTGKPTD